jgi:hypothetical protein
MPCSITFARMLDRSYYRSETTLQQTTRFVRSNSHQNAKGCVHALAIDVSHDRIGVVWRVDSTVQRSSRRRSRARVVKVGRVARRRQVGLRDARRGINEERGAYC